MAYALPYLQASERDTLRIVAAGGFLLARLGEIADSLQVADDTREIIHILTAADGALVQVALVYMPAIVASRIGDVEGEVVGALLRRHAEQVAILRLREVLFEITMQRRAAREVRHILPSMESELVQHIERGVFHNVEITVVAVSRHDISVFPIPLGMLHPDILGGNHLAVEEYLFCSIVFVEALYCSEDSLHEGLILRIVVDGYS